jgi:6-phosphogluconolactonase
MKSTILLLSMLFLFSSILAQNSKEYYLLIGTYSNKDKSNGIYVYKFNTESGAFEPAQPVTSSVNASYLAISGDRKNVYAVSESGGGNGGVNAYSFDPLT